MLFIIIYHINDVTKPHILIFINYIFLSLKRIICDNILYYQTHIVRINKIVWMFILNFNTSINFYENIFQKNIH